MVLVPSFTIEQTETHVILHIRVPYVKISMAELLIEGTDFSFYCKPYLLKLTFPHEVLSESDLSSAKYDPDDNNGTLTVMLCKQESGLHFPDLDILSKLLTTQSIANLHTAVEESGIEVLHSEHFVDQEEDDEENEEIIGPHRNDTPLTIASSSSSFSYGFNNQYSSIFSRARELLPEYAEISDPDHFSPAIRRSTRIALENQAFDAYRYLGDFTDGEDDPVYQAAMSYQPFWVIAWDQRQNSKEKIADEVLLQFSSLETEIMTQKLKNKEFLIADNSIEQQSLLFNLVDIIFSFAYDHRLTEGDENGNTESAYNITRLSAVFSCFEQYVPPQDDVLTVIKFCMRRVVAYPYLRHWKLGRKILGDVAKIFLLGKRAVFKCLLQLYHIFEHTETHYLLNKVFITDYCSWIQSRPDSLFKSFGKQLNVAKNALESSPFQGKGAVGFHLPNLEDFLADIHREDDTDNSEEDIEEVGDKVNVDNKIPPLLLIYNFTDVNDPAQDYLRHAHVEQHPLERPNNPLDSQSLAVSGSVDAISDALRSRLKIVAVDEEEKEIAPAQKVFKKVLIEDITQSDDS